MSEDVKCPVHLSDAGEVGGPHAFVSTEVDVKPGREKVDFFWTSVGSPVEAPKKNHFGGTVAETVTMVGDSGSCQGRFRRVTRCLRTRAGAPRESSPTGARVAEGIAGTEGQGAGGPPRSWDRVPRPNPRRTPGPHPSTGCPSGDRSLVVSRVRPRLRRRDPPVDRVASGCVARSAVAGDPDPRPGPAALFPGPVGHPSLELARGTAGALTR